MKRFLIGLGITAVIANFVLMILGAYCIIPSPLFYGCP